MKLPHDWEYLEHLLRRRGSLPPVSTAVGDMGHLLPRAEAVIYCAAAKAKLPEVAVNTAAEISLQVVARLSGGFIYSKIY